MEGTKHEKITLVVLGYLIGAVTVFLGTCLPQKKSYDYSHQLSTPVIEINQKQDETSEFSDEATSVDNSTIAGDAANEEAAVANGVRYVDGALRITLADAEYVLSVHQDLLPADTTSFTQQGFHVSEPAYKMSPDGRFVFFCEQHDAGADNCHGFIYDTAANVIQILQSDGERLVLTIPSALSAAWEGSNFRIEGLASIDAEKPWIVQ
jgi:hypothetical protein